MAPRRRIDRGAIFECLFDQRLKADVSHWLSWN
jgi:hypothetical protein